MSADLDRLPADEEQVRRLPHAGYDPGYAASAVQNVLDALNLYRCRAVFAEQELARVSAELTEVRESAHHNRIFGSIEP